MSLFKRIFKSNPATNETVLDTGLKNHVIEFTLWKDDLALEIQLEPECMIFKVEPGSSIKFVAVADSDFEWSLRTTFEFGVVQLFPGGAGNYDIEIFENSKLLEDWYKYMC